VNAIIVLEMVGIKTILMLVTIIPKTGVLKMGVRFKDNVKNVMGKH